MKQSVKFALVAPLAALLATLAGCSFMEGDRIDYKSAARGVTLDVPPDLTQLSRDPRTGVARLPHKLLETDTHYGFDKGGQGGFEVRPPTDF